MTNMSLAADSISGEFTAETKLLLALEDVFRAFEGDVTWREREALRGDVHRAVDVYFAAKVGK